MENKIQIENYRKKIIEKYKYLFSWENYLDCVILIHNNIYNYLKISKTQTQISLRRAQYREIS